MSIELLTELEQRIQNAVETIELLKMEIDDLRQENADLRQDRQAWEEQLTRLLGKFSALDDAVNPETETPEEAPLELDEIPENTTHFHPS